MQCVISSQVLAIPRCSVCEEAVSDEQSPSYFSDATLPCLKMVIGFCTAGLAGSPASWKPAWKAVMLSYALLTHLACSSGYPSLCDDRTCWLLPLTRGYPLGWSAGE